jgi:hypothetical protein
LASEGYVLKDTLPFRIIALSSTATANDNKISQENFKESGC